MRERLQKILAAAGVASRRDAEELIRQGKVTVNGRVVTQMGAQADSRKDVIHVAGQRVYAEPLRTIMFYKPRGVLTTLDDPSGRSAVADFIKDEPVRLFPVGRLDRQSEGLLLLTNDGELANLLTHPRYGVAKIYQAALDRPLTLVAQQRLEQGVELEDGPTLPIKVVPLPQKEGNWYQITIREGRNRQIRRMFTAVDYTVERLRRVQIGNLKLGDLRPGGKRPLTALELSRLLQLAHGSVGSEESVSGKTAKPRKAIPSGAVRHRTALQPRGVPAKDNKPPTTRRQQDGKLNPPKEGTGGGRRSSGVAGSLQRGFPRGSGASVGKGRPPRSQT
ncbi:MAG: rRNA pseudouridine synthase [Symbiobacteriaceae bacterium]|nr:rRNA pseudouridine synthase [Symbiobacteriaceae bacterium]